jgi:hypothetical protein
MTDDSLFDDAFDLEITDLACGGLSVERSDYRPHVPSTAESRKRYAFLRTKRVGDTWHEVEGGRYLYRYGPQGVTVWDTWEW